MCSFITASKDQLLHNYFWSSFYNSTNIYNIFADTWHFNTIPHQPGTTSSLFYVSKYAKSIITPAIFIPTPYPFLLPQ